MRQKFVILVSILTIVGSLLSPADDSTAPTAPASGEVGVNVDSLPMPDDLVQGMRVANVNQTPMVDSTSIPDESDGGVFVEDAFAGDGSQAYDVQDSEQGRRPVLERRFLNPDAVELIFTETSMTTTVVFPEKISSFDGAGFSADPNAETAQFTYSFTPGTNHLSVYALAPGARANLNVFVGGKCYVLLFIEERGRGVFRVSFSDAKSAASAAETARNNRLERRNLQVGPSRLLGVLDKAKAYPLLVKSNPEAVQDMWPVYPGSITPNDGFKVVLNAVYRHNQFDTLVFECALLNESESEIFYDPETFKARVSDKLYVASFVDASGKLPARGQAQAWFLVTGDSTQGSNALDPRNPFEITVDRIQGGACEQVQTNPVFSEK